MGCTEKTKDCTEKIKDWTPSEYTVCYDKVIQLHKDIPEKFRNDFSRVGNNWCLKDQFFPDRIRRRCPACNADAQAPCVRQDSVDDTSEYSLCVCEGMRWVCSKR